MRLLTGLVASGLATLAAASSSSSASVFELAPSTKGSKNALHVSPIEARLAFAQRLGVSRFHKLGSEDVKARSELLEQLSRGSGRMFKDAKQDGNVLISIEGLEDAERALPAASRLMFIDDMPGNAATRDFLKSLTAEKFELLGEASELVGSTPIGSTCMSGSRAFAEDETHNLQRYNYWEFVGKPKDYPESVPHVITKEIQDTFSPNTSEDVNFVRGYLMFKAFLEYSAPAIREKGSFGFCHLQELLPLIQAYGTDSSQVKLATKLFVSLISNLTPTPGDTLLLLPPTTSTSPGAEVFNHIHHKREEVILSSPTNAPPNPQTLVLSTPKKVLTTSRTPATRYPQCFISQSACETGTDSCSSGRGTCQKSVFPENCWKCACKPTVERNENGGQKKTYWAGSACQKQDISTPFNLFLWFTLAIVGVLAWAIGLLFSVGSEELPSVLSAGVAPPKRA
ncbi:hypothetical protein RUND412_006316 [Rhizina undulata]